MIQFLFLFLVLTPISAQAALKQDPNNWKLVYFEKSVQIPVELPPKLPHTRWDMARETTVSGEIFIEFFYWSPALTSGLEREDRNWKIYRKQEGKFVEVFHEPVGFRIYDSSEGKRRILEARTSRVRIHKSSKGEIQFIVDGRPVKALTPGK